MPKVIAIDGPSASGKTTISRAVAKELGWVHVDSGAFYRALTWVMLQRGIDVRDVTAVEGLLLEFEPDFFVNDQKTVAIRIDGKVLNQELRGTAVSENVSPLASLPSVRARVLSWLRDMQRFGSLVMEGRDIGTVVFPDAVQKFYLDADPEERARRRQQETVAEEDRGVAATLESLQKRDERDRSRKVAPLRVAADACVLDTTGMDIEAVVALVLRHIREKQSQKPE